MGSNRAENIYQRYTEDPLIRSLRVQAWFQAVSLSSGKTPAQLEREFSERRSPPRMLPRSCIWEKYRRGEIVPRGGRRADGSLNLLERVEVRYPGTKVWLLSPLWRVADKTPMEMSEIRRIYEGMPNFITSIFVAPKTKSQGLFWRRPVDIDHACEILLRLRGVNGLIALLAMMREAETIQDQEQHFVAAEAANRHLTELCATHEIIGSGLGASLHRYLRKSLARPGYFDVPLDLLAYSDITLEVDTR